MAAPAKPSGPAFQTLVNGLQGPYDLSDLGYKLIPTLKTQQVQPNMMLFSF